MLVYNEIYGFPKSYVKTIKKIKLDSLRKNSKRVKSNDHNIIKII